MAIENTLGNITFNGVDLSQNNIFVQHYPLMGAPSRRQTAISGIAHRNAVFDEKEYDNVEVELDFVIVADTFDELSDRRAFLFRTLDVGGYVPVKIDPDPFVYYMYRTSDMKETLFDGNPLNWIRVITVTFSRDPFKYYDVNDNRNYFLNSSGYSLDKWYNNSNLWSITTDSTKGSVFTSQPTVVWTGGIQNALSQGRLNGLVGQQVTVSFWAKADKANANFHSEPQGGAVTFNPKLTTSWVRYSYTIPNLATASIYFISVDIGTTYYLDDIKVEIGNKATDWTPAPEDGIEITTSGTTITNPYNYESLPKITIYANTGTGTTNVSINGVIQLKNVNGSIVLDSMLEDAYWLDSSGNYVNGNASMLKPYFPRLQPQLNAITFDSTVSKVVITPRWRTL